MRLIRLITFSAVFVSVFCACPNNCNGHGSCGVSNLCSCFDGWNGGAVDCSARNCPKGPAWADKAFAQDRAHQNAECSNAGICDRGSGVCKCFAGFTGTACQRTSCPNDCSGHGVCSTIRDVSVYQGPDYDSTVTFYGDGKGVEYQNWDASSIQLCECDNGFFGSDCSLVMCPKGDDPLTVNQNYRKIYLRVRSTGSFDLTGYIGLQFHGEVVYVRMTGVSSETCTEDLSFRGKFGQVGCVFTFVTRLIFDFELTFYNWPTFPKDNNLYEHDGNPSKYDFYCDLTQTAGFTTCRFTDLENTNIREYAYCSNRGLCNFQTGTCACNPGFGGPACSNATFLYTQGSNSLPGLQVNVNGLDYVSTAIQVKSDKSKASDFYFLEAIAGDETVFYVRGDGTVAINKLRTLSGGQTISGGGLYVEEGGCTIADSGLNVFSESSSKPVLDIRSRYSSTLTSGYTAVQISSEGTDPSQFVIFKTLNQGSVKFSIRGDGAVLVRGGGIMITGGISLNQGGLKVTGGVTINSGGLTINGGGISVTGGMTVNSHGLKITQNGFEVYGGGGSIYSGGFKVQGGVSIISGGFFVTNGASVGSGGLSVTGGITVRSRGLFVSQSGATINSGGVVVNSGGVQVNSGGLRVVSDGIDVDNGGVYVASGGLSIVQNGLVVTGGASVTGGLVVTTGVSVRSTGIRVTGGATIYSSGLRVTGGATISNAGLFVSGGLTVRGDQLNALDGSSITDGLTIISGGISITAGGLTIETGRLVCESESEFNRIVRANDGLVVNNGMTVNGAISFQSAPSVSDRRLKTNLIPIRDALYKVSKLQGVYFDWVQDEQLRGELSLDDRRHVGVLAQEVEQVLPEVVSELQEGRYLGVDYSAMVPLLIEAIHDLEEKFSDEVEGGGRDNCVVLGGKVGVLVGRVAELEKDNLEMKKEIEMLKMKLN